MTDMDVAILLIKAASVADGGCAHCAEGVLDAAIKMRPELPWRMAAKGLAEDNDDYDFALWATDAATVGE